MLQRARARSTPFLRVGAPPRRGAASPTRCAPAICTRAATCSCSIRPICSSSRRTFRASSRRSSPARRTWSPASRKGSTRRRSSRGIYNRLSRTLFHVPVKDLNSVKAYRREIMDALPVRPDWHRYMIVIAAAQGFTVTEIPVPLYPRHAGQVEVRPRRAFRSACSTCSSVWFELRFGKKPLLLFGMLGAGAVRDRRRSPASSRCSCSSSTDVGIRAVWTLIQTCLILGSVFFATGLARRADRRTARRSARAAPPARRAEAARRVVAVVPHHATASHRSIPRTPPADPALGLRARARRRGALGAARPAPRACATSPSDAPAVGARRARGRDRAAHLRAAHRGLAARARRPRRRRSRSARRGAHLVRLQPRALAARRVLAARRHDGDDAAPRRTRHRLHERGDRSSRSSTSSPASPSPTAFMRDDADDAARARAAASSPPARSRSSLMPVARAAARRARAPRHGPGDRHPAARPAPP